MTTPYLQRKNMKAIPKKYWLDKSNLLDFAKCLGEHTGRTCPSDWLNISQKEIKNYGGSGMLGKYYGGSPIRFVKELVPGTASLREWEFTTVPQGFWNKPSNVRKYLNWLFNKKAFKKMADFYKFTVEDFRTNGGIGLLDRYGNCILDVLCVAFPECKWYPWLMNITTMGSWKTPSTILEYAKRLEHDLGITDPSGWYNHDSTTIDRNRGAGLLQNEFGGSYIAFLRFIYPDYPFRLYMFKKTPDGFWGEKENRVSYLADLSHMLGFTTPEDWYRITYDDMREFHGAGLLDRYGGSPSRVIMENIDYLWNKSRFTKRGVSVAQIKFFTALSALIKHSIRHALCPEGEYRIEGSRFKADGYLEIYGLRIVIEYDGCYWHGCPSCYPYSDNTHPCGKTYGVLYESTQQRAEKIRSLGYVVLSVRSCDYLSPTFDMLNWFVNSLQPYVTTPLVF